MGAGLIGSGIGRVSSEWLVAVVKQRFAEGL